MSRYIDADKLMLHLNDYKLQVSPSWKDEWERMVSCLVIDTCMEAVQEQPTADVRENIQLDVCPLYGGACGYPSGECYDCPRHGNFRENVRGEWISTGFMEVKCSNCKETFHELESANFCPSCGADMRGGRTEE